MTSVRPGERDHRVAPPIAEPVITGDDGLLLPARDDVLICGCKVSAPMSSSRPGALSDYLSSPLDLRSGVIISASYFASLG